MAITPDPRLVSIADLSVQQGPRPLGVAADRLFASALDDHVHVIVQDPARRVQHVRIDAQGQPILLGDLPLAAPVDVAACAGALFVSGWTATSDAVVVRIASDGSRTIPVATTPPVQIWPRPVCIAGAPWLIWTSGDPATVQIAEATGGPPQTLALGDHTDQLAAVGDERGLWLARLHGPDRRLAVSRIVDGKVVTTREVAATLPTAPSLARLGDGVALSWIEPPGRVQVLQLDASAQSVLPAATFDAPPRDGPLDGARLHGAGDGALALVAWSRAPADVVTVHGADGETRRREPRRETRLRVVAYDWRTRQLGPPHRIDPDQLVHAAAWMNGALWVIHAGADLNAQLSVFARVPSPTP